MINWHTPDARQPLATQFVPTRDTAAPARTELAAVLFSLISFVTIALVVFSHREPFTDEVMDAEVPINITRGLGCVSFAHGTATPGSPVAFPAPAYLYGLAGWLSVLGVSRATVLAFNCVVVSMSVLLLWAASCRTFLAQSPLLRIALVCYLPLLPATKLIYSTNRYDSIGMLGCALACFLLTLPKSITRSIMLVVAGALIGTGGLHVALAGVAVTAAVTLMARHPIFPDIFLLTVAIVCGVAATLGLIYFDPGKAKSFSAHMLIDAVHAPLSVIDLLNSLFRGGHPNVMLGGNAFLLCALAVLLLCNRKTQGGRAQQKYGLLALAAGLVTPLTLTMAGRYSFTYAWIAAFPMAIGAISLLATRGLSIKGLVVALPLLAAAAAGGLPLSVAATVMDWSANDYQRVTDFVKSQIHPDDVAYSTYGNYYPLKQSKATAYFGMAVHTMSRVQKESVTVLFLSEHDTKGTFFSPTREFIFSELGGSWQECGSLVVPRGDFRMALPPPPRQECTYKVRAFRRASQP